MAECEAAGMRISTSKSEAVLLSRNKVERLPRVGEGHRAPSEGVQLPRRVTMQFLCSCKNKRSSCCNSICSHGASLAPKLMPSSQYQKKKTVCMFFWRQASGSNQPAALGQ